MSPSEYDLRSALHQGEGEPLDPQRMIAAGRAERSRRRTRLAGVAAAIVLVAGGGGVTAALVSGDDGGTRPPDAAAGPAQEAAPSSASSTTSGAFGPGRAVPEPTDAPSEGRGGILAPDVRDIRCPTSFPQRLLPGGGSPGRFGADGDLFPTTPVSVVICSYGDPDDASDSSPGGPARTTLTEAAAAQLVASLENARREPTGNSCDRYKLSYARDFALVGVGADGRALRTVTTTVTEPVCDTRTSNGTAVRFAWQPPASLRAVLDAIPTDGPTEVAPRPQPTGKKYGSPVR